jgi:hypothetical protein
MNLSYLLLNFVLFLFLFQTVISNSNIQSNDNENEVTKTVEILNEGGNYAKEVNILNNKKKEIQDLIDQLNNNELKRKLGAAGEGSTVYSAFGALRDVNVRKSTLSIIAVIVGVLCVELFFHKINHIAIDTPFESILNSVQKELMIVGCMAFIFKIVLQLSTFIAIEWLIPLEFADLLIPITSFIFCTQALFMIIMSVEQCNTWSRAYHLHINEILDEFYQYHLTHLMFIFRQIYLPISTIHEEIEFRVFHSIFCDEYQVKKSGFSFDEYVQRIFEKLLMDTLKIEIFDWFIISVICGLNWGRSKLEWNMVSCDVSELECGVLNSLEIYFLMGCVMLGIVFFLTISARIFQVRLLNKVGIKSCDDYTHYLQQAEIRLGGENDTHLTEKELKVIILDTKSKLIKERTSYLPHGHGEEHSKSIRKSLDRALHNLFSLLSKIYDYILSFVHYEARLIQREAKGGKHLISQKLKKLKAKITKQKTTNKEFARSHEVAHLEKNRRDSRVPIPNVGPDANINHNNLSHDPHDPNHADATFDHGFKDSKFISEIFWFGKPEIFFDVVEVFTMIISFYIALWIVNYAFAANYLHEHVTFWKVITILPGIFCLFLYIYLIKVTALLRAITHVDSDIVESTIEVAENSKTLSNQMRSKILDKLEDYVLDDNSSNHDKLEILINEIDEDESRTLSRGELQLFLEALGITLSRSRWRVIFREIDRNYDDQISYDELFLFLFPDDINAKAEERKRLKRIGNRGVRNSQKYMESTYLTQLKSKLCGVFGFNDGNKVIPTRNFRSGSMNSTESDDEFDIRKTINKIEPVPLDNV